MKRGFKYLLSAILVYMLVLTAYLISSPPEKNTGKITSNAIISFEVLPVCFIPLENGWNLISFCTNLTNKSVQNALLQINNSYRYVMEWNASNQEFMIYSPLAYTNPFTEFNMNKSYFIYFDESNMTNLYCQGTVFNDLNLSLLFGWNTPTYPYEFGTNITQYFNIVDFRYMMKWNASNQEFMIYSPLASSNPFETIALGEGQFIYVGNAGGSYLFYNRTYLQ